MVGAMSITYTNPLRRLVAERRNSGSTPGARMPVTASPEPRRGRRRAHHEHRVVRGIDVGEHPPDQLVDAVQRRPLLGTRLVVGEEVGVEVGAQQVGTLDEDDAALLPRVGERAVGGVVVGAQAERRVRIGLEQVVAHAARGNATLAVHQRVHRRALVRLERVVDHRLRAVAVGDHRARDLRLLERVAERADRRVVEPVGVLLHQRLEAQVHDAAVAVDAGALAVDGAAVLSP